MGVDEITLALRTAHNQVLKLLNVVSLPGSYVLHHAMLDALTTRNIRVVLTAIVGRLLGGALSSLDVSMGAIKEGLDFRKGTFLFQLHVTLEVGSTALAKLKLVRQIVHDGRVEEDFFLRVVDSKAYIDKLGHIETGSFCYSLR